MRTRPEPDHPAAAADQGQSQRSGLDDLKPRYAAFKINIF
jgi:hypothetical protein